MKIRLKDCACEPAQHTAVMGDYSACVNPLGGMSGPIAVLPRQTRFFVDAVQTAGGVVAPLDGQTRGLIWLSYTRTVELSEILADNPQISWVQLPFSGVDAFSDVIAEHSLEHRVFTSAKGAYAQPVAEHALGLMLAVLRFLPRRARAIGWDDIPRGISLYGKNVTIIGAGGIARELIRLLEPFNVRVTIVRRSDRPVPGATLTVSSAQLSDVLPSADVVVIAAALTVSTRHLLGAPELALMKPSAGLVNIARGALVDSLALAAALSSGELLGAAVDVTDPEPLPEGHVLWRTPNMLITPHMADTPDMTAPLLAEWIKANVDAFINDTPFLGVVDEKLGY